MPLDQDAWLYWLFVGSRFEAWLLSAHKAFNSRLNIFTHVCGYTVHLDEMSRLYEVAFLQHVFRVADTLQQLQLSIEEECIFKGMIVLSRGTADYAINSSRMRVLYRSSFRPL